ncbi:membrane protein [Vibrio astriarenae]|nr:membrane protein [Vibrio sp. C7]
MFKLLLVSASVLASTVALADDNPEFETITLPSPWSSEVEFGYQAHSGNSDTQSLNSRLDVEYISGRHRTYGEWKYYLLYKDGDEDKRQSTYSLQSDYKLGPKTYLYGSFRGVDSKYSAYFKDYTLSGGLGYQFYNTDQLILELEVGPGYRYQEPNLDEIDDDDIIFPDLVEEAIFRSNLNTQWSPLDTVTFAAEITLVSGRVIHVSTVTLALPIPSPMILR